MKSLKLYFIILFSILSTSVFATSQVETTNEPAKKTQTILVIDTPYKAHPKTDGILVSSKDIAEDPSDSAHANKVISVLSNTLGSNHASKAEIQLLTMSVNNFITDEEAKQMLKHLQSLPMGSIINFSATIDPLNDPEFCSSLARVMEERDLIMFICAGNESKAASYYSLNDKYWSVSNKTRKLIQVLKNDILMQRITVVGSVVQLEKLNQDLLEQIGHMKIYCPWRKNQKSLIPREQAMYQANELMYKTFAKHPGAWEEILHLERQHGKEIFFNNANEKNINASFINYHNSIGEKIKNIFNNHKIDIESLKHQLNIFSRQNGHINASNIGEFVSDFIQKSSLIPFKNSKKLFLAPHSNRAGNFAEKGIFLCGPDYLEVACFDEKDHPITKIDFGTSFATPYVLRKFAEFKQQRASANVNNVEVLDLFLRTQIEPSAADEQNIFGRGVLICEETKV